MTYPDKPLKYVVQKWTSNADVWLFNNTVHGTILKTVDDTIKTADLLRPNATELHWVYAYDEDSHDVHGYALVDLAPVGYASTSSRVLAVELSSTYEDTNELERLKSKVEAQIWKAGIESQMMVHTTQGSRMLRNL